MTRTVLSVVVGLGALAVGLWTATLASRNHAKARELDRRQREYEALDIAIDRLENEVKAEEERLRRAVVEGEEPEDEAPVGELAFPALEGVR